MNDNKYFLWAVCFLAGALSSIGCAKQYQLPKQDEPAAIVKLKTSLNKEKALSMPSADGFSRHVSVAVNLKEKESWFHVMTKNDPAPFSSGPPAEMEVLTFRIHPDRPVVLSANLGVNWQTQKMETVWETKRVPKQVSETVSEYDYYSKGNKMVTRTKTVYETQRYQTTKMVTRNHGSGCGATVSFTPQRDSVYLLDYSNPSISGDCTMSVYRQTQLPDGKFKLEPVEQKIVDEKPVIKKPEEPEPVKPEEMKEGK